MLPPFFKKQFQLTLSDRKGTIAYFHDILVFADTKSQHVLFLDTVKRRLAAQHFEINYEKSVFEFIKLEFLGRKIYSKRIHVSLAFMKPIRHFPTPENKSHLLSFLGMVGYF